MHTKTNIRNRLPGVLRAIESGAMTAGEALNILGTETEHDLGYARVDIGRLHRRGFPEVIYSPGKTARQIVGIMRAMKAAGQNCMATRATPEQFMVVNRNLRSAKYHADARIITLDIAPLTRPQGLVAVVSAGTSDIPVAAEAALVARRMGARVETVYDVGVAGLHRTLRHLDLLRSARVLVVVAGLEGALPSVIGGLVGKPIIAVPTSVGYGASFKGVAALLAMLNSCAPGVAVVNIDNGFGAGVMAAMINRGG